MNGKTIPICAADAVNRVGLQGLVALVVGGGSGIGEATARTFAANKGSVVVADIQDAAAQRVAEAIEVAGGEAISASMDIGRQADIDAMIDTTLKRFGRLDAVLNAAALVRPALLESCEMDEWRRCFEVNVDGALQLAKACLPLLRLSPAASLVNVTSLGGVWGRPNGGAYGPSKAALMTLSRQLALEWAPYGVRVNAVNPGTILTPLALQTVPAEVLTRRAADIPQRRLGEPSEMADLIVFLLSPSASYITAQVFTCDGGHSQSLFSAPMGQA